MRFATYEQARGRQHVGIVDGTGLVDIAYVAGGEGAPPPRDMVDLASSGIDAAALLETLELRAANPVAIDSVRLLTPIQSITTLLAVRDLSGGEARFDSIPPASVIAPGAPIVIRAEYGPVVPSAAIGAVIGHPLSRVTPEEARSAVFGYTVINDVTAVDLARSDCGAVTRAKGMDTFTPCGPWIATPDEMPAHGAAQLRVDGVIVSEHTVSDVVTGVGERLSQISQFVRLIPGDVVQFGLGDEAAGVDLRDAGACSVTIDGIGELHSPVQLAAA